MKDADPSNQNLESLLPNKDLNGIKEQEFSALGETLHIETTLLTNLALDIAKPLLDDININHLEGQGQVLVKAPFTLDRSFIEFADIKDNRVQSTLSNLGNANLVIASLMWGTQQEFTKWKVNEEKEEREYFKYSFPENMIAVAFAIHNETSLMFLPNTRSKAILIEDPNLPNAGDVLKVNLQEIVTSKNKHLSKNLGIEELDWLSSIQRLILPVNDTEKNPHTNSQGQQFQEYKAPFKAPITLSRGEESYTDENPGPKAAMIVAYFEMFPPNLETIFES